jgi:hypothetical protein
MRGFKLLASPKIVGTIKSKRLGWAGASMGMREKRNT